MNLKPAISLLRGRNSAVMRLESPLSEDFKTQCYFTQKLIMYIASDCQLIKEVKEKLFYYSHETLCLLRLKQ